MNDMISNIDAYVDSAMENDDSFSTFLFAWMNLTDGGRGDDFEEIIQKLYQKKQFHVIKKAVQTEAIARVLFNIAEKTLRQSHGEYTISNFVSNNSSHEFDELKHKLLKKTGVYMLYLNEHSTKPLYIGKSINLYKRIKGSCIERRLGWCEIFLTKNHEDAISLERFLIKEIDPALNRQQGIPSDVHFDISSVELIDRVEVIELSLFHQGIFTEINIEGRCI